MGVMGVFWRALMHICRLRALKVTPTIHTPQEFKAPQTNAKRKEVVSKYPLSGTYKRETVGPWSINLIMAQYQSELRAIDFSSTRAAFSTTATVMWITR
jgi:hypothetical protein